MIFPFALCPLSFNADRALRTTQNCSWVQWIPVGLVFIPNQCFDRAGKSLLFSPWHESETQIKVANPRWARTCCHTPGGAGPTGHDTSTCSQAQAISLFKIDCALQNCIPVSGSKKCYKLLTAALIDQYCHLIPARMDTLKFREVLFLPLSPHIESSNFSLKEVGGIPADTKASKSIENSVFFWKWFCASWLSESVYSSCFFLAVFNSPLLWLELQPAGSSLAAQYC